MLGIHKRRQPAVLLRLGDNLQRDRRLARRLRPKISITRPRGTPPTPSAPSKLIDPVEITEIGTSASRDPRRTMDPFPNCFSIWLRANSTAFVRSSATGMVFLLYKYLPCAPCWEDQKTRVG